MTASPEQLVLHLERVLRAAPPLAFRMHTEAERLARWWGPRGFTALTVALDMRPGGAYRIEMQPPDGAAFFLTGEFLKVDPPAQLSYTFRWEDPHPDDQETVVDLSFVDLGDSTKLIVDQGPFLTKARRDLHAQGWSETLDRLHALLAADAEEAGRSM